MWKLLGLLYSLKSKGRTWVGGYSSWEWLKIFLKWSSKFNWFQIIRGVILMTFSFLTSCAVRFCIFWGIQCGWNSSLKMGHWGPYMNTLVDVIKTFLHKWVRFHSLSSLVKKWSGLRDTSAALWSHKLKALTKETMKKMLLLNQKFPSLNWGTEYMGRILMDHSQLGDILMSKYK